LRNTPLFCFAINPSTNDLLREACKDLCIYLLSFHQDQPWTPRPASTRGGQLDLRPKERRLPIDQFRALLSVLALSALGLIFGLLVFLKLTVRT
jgi:hypothetical protein